MDRIQFSKEFKANGKSFKNFATKLTKNSSDAEDLVQQTAFKALRGLHTYQDGTNFKNWVFAIIRNTFITNYRKKKRANIVGGPLENFTFNIESKSSIHNNAVSEMRIEEIYNKIDSLSVKTKKPFLMLVEGYKYGEIADTLDIPIGTVKSRINYARKKLQAVLEERHSLAA